MAQNSKQSAQNAIGTMLITAYIKALPLKASLGCPFLDILLSDDARIVVS